jgi:exodeoxyribonuclease VII small subunit
MAQNEDLTFEEALRRLEEIAEKLDDGELSLEEALAHFQEGSALRELCERKLAEAEAQVEELLREDAGEGEPAAAETLFGDEP